MTSRALRVAVATRSLRKTEVILTIITTQINKKGRAENLNTRLIIDSDDSE